MVNREPGSVVSDERVAGYELEALLGSGSFGKVYRARDREGRTVALKIAVRTAGELSTRDLVLQQNEIEALTRLGHPALVEVYGSGITADGRIYLAMELVEGPTLGQFMHERAEPLELVESLAIARKIAQALSHCHELGVLHLDLKPQNIVVVDPAAPHVKVLDFGLAGFRAETGLSHTAGKLAGTLPYMAPEFFHGGDLSRAVSPRADLYALGVILFEMLSGRLPYRGSDAMARRLEHEAPELSSLDAAIPGELSRLVAELLCLDPARRCGSAAALEKRLRGLYYAILGGASEPGPQPEIAQLSHTEAVFVGRERERRSLLELIEQSGESPRGRFALIVGEAGIGKSRFVAETLTPVARGGDALVLHGRCRPLEELVGYLPLRELLSQLVAIVGGAVGARGVDLGEALRAGSTAGVLAVLGELAPELHGYGGDGEEDLTVLKFSGAERVARALQTLLGELARVSPVVVVLEDVHWIDTGTRAAVEHLMAAGLPAGVVVIATSRPVDNPITVDPGAVMQLAPLDIEDSARMIRGFIGEHDPQLVAAVQRAVPLLSSGNPLFISQVIHNLTVEGVLTPTADGRLALAEVDMSSYEPPESVSAVLGRTIERLDPHARRVLGVAALIGRRFDPADVAGTGLFTAEAVARAVEEATRLHLCHGVNEQVSFAHDTIREHLAGELEAVAAAHAGIARQLQRRGAAPASVAPHLEQAGERLAAIEAYYQAGLDAGRAHDPVGGSTHLHRAFDLLITEPLDDRLQLLLARITYQRVTISESALGSTDESLELIERCRAAIPEPNPEVIAALDSASARLQYVVGNTPAAMEASKRCLAVIAEHPRLYPYQCFPANQVGRALCITGKFGPAVDVLTRGCELANETGELAELAHSLGLLGVSHGFVGDLAAAREHSDAGLELARRLGDPLRILGGLVYTSVVCEIRGDCERGLRDTTELLACAEGHRIGGLYLYCGTGFAGRQHFYAGSLRRAGVLLDNAINLSAILKMKPILAWFQAYRGDVCFVAGNLERARGHYEAGLEAAAAIGGDAYAEPLCEIGLAHIESRVGGKLELIHERASRALERLASVGNVISELVVLQRYAESLEGVEAEQEAASAWARREALAQRLGVTHSDFWPELPPRSEAASSRRAYWIEWGDRASERSGVSGPLARADTLSLEAPTRSEGDVHATYGPATEEHVISDEQLRITRDEPMNAPTLLRSFATIENFVPDFVTK